MCIWKRAIIPNPKGLVIPISRINANCLSCQSEHLRAWPGLPFLPGFQKSISALVTLTVPCLHTGCSSSSGFLSPENPFLWFHTRLLKSTPNFKDWRQLLRGGVFGIKRFPQHSLCVCGCFTFGIYQNRNFHSNYLRRLISPLLSMLFVRKRMALHSVLQFCIAQWLGLLFNCLRPGDWVAGSPKQQAFSLHLNCLNPKLLNKWQVPKFKDKFSNI